MKFQVGLVKKLGQHLPVKVIYIEDADFALEIFYIFYNIVGSGFVHREFVLIHAKLLYHLHEGVDGEGVVLHGDAEPFPGLLLGHIFGLHQFILFHYLPGIAQEFFSFRVHQNPSVGTAEQFHADFLLQFPDGGGQTGLGDKQGAGRLVQRAGVGHGDGVAKLGKGHDRNPFFSQRFSRILMAAST